MEINDIHTWIIATGEKQVNILQDPNYSERKYIVLWCRDINKLILTSVSFAEELGVGWSWPCKKHTRWPTKRVQWSPLLSHPKEAVLFDFINPTLQPHTGCTPRVTSLYVPETAEKPRKSYYAVRALGAALIIERSGWDAAQLWPRRLPPRDYFSSSFAAFFFKRSLDFFFLKQSARYYHQKSYFYLVRWLFSSMMYPSIKTLVKASLCHTSTCN